MYTTAGVIMLLVWYGGDSDMHMLRMLSSRVVRI
jgi:hypothetical protein